MVRKKLLCVLNSVIACERFHTSRDHRLRNTSLESAYVSCKFLLTSYKHGMKKGRNMMAKLHAF